MTMRQMLLLLGLIAVSAGAVLGFVVVPVQGGECGSAFFPDERGTADYNKGWDIHSGVPCRNALNNRLAISMVLLLPGAVMAVGAVAIGRRDAA